MGVVLKQRACAIKMAAYHGDDSQVERVKAAARMRKGRGFTENDREDERLKYDSIEDTGGQGPMRSIEGWIVFVSNIHEEAQEDEITDRFAEYGEIKNIHVNLDRRTGFIKGYSLIEYETYKEAQAAISAMDGSEFLGNVIRVDWAFVKPPKPGRRSSGGVSR